MYSYQIPIGQPPCSLQQHNSQSTANSDCPLEVSLSQCTVAWQWLRNRRDRVQEPSAVRANPPIVPHRECTGCTPYRLDWGSAAIRQEAAESLDTHQGFQGNSPFLPWTSQRRHSSPSAKPSPVQYVTRSWQTKFLATSALSLSTKIVSWGAH